MLQGVGATADDRTLRYHAYLFAEQFKDEIQTPSFGIDRSAIPFAPQNSVIKKLYATNNTPKVAGTKDVRIIALTDARISTVLFSPDASTIVSLTHSKEKHIKVWDASTLATVKSTLELIPYPHRNRGTSSGFKATFSPDGSKIAIDFIDGTMRLWDCMTAKLLLGPVHHASESSPYGSSNLAFSRDGTKIILGCGNGICGLVYVWDTTTGVPLLTLFGHTDGVHSVAFSTDEFNIASGSADTTVRIWDASTGKLLEIFSGHTGTVHHVSFSPNGSQIASGSNDKTVRLWNVATGRPLIHPLAHTGSVYFVKFFAGGTRLLSGSSDGTIRLWEIANGTPLETILTYGRSPWCFVPSHDERSLVFPDSKTLQIWDVSNLAHSPEPISAYAGGFTTFMFSPNGVKLALRSDKEYICVENALTGRRSIPPFRTNVNCVGFSRDGTRIVSGSSGASLQVWDASTGASILGPIQCPSRPRYGSHSIDENSAGLDICAVAFSLDGSQIVSGFLTGELWIISAITGVTLLEPKKFKDKAIISLAFSPDGAKTVVLSEQSSIYVFHASTGKLIQTWVYCADSISSNRSKHPLPLAPSIHGSAPGPYPPRRVQSFHLLRHTPTFDSPRRSRSLASIQRVPSQIAGVKHPPALPKSMWYSLNPPDLGDGRAFASLSPDESKIIAGLPDRSIRIWDFRFPAHIMTSDSNTLIPSGAHGPVNVGKTIVVIPEYIKDYRLCMIEKEVVVFSIFLRQFFVIDLSPYL